MSKFQVSQFAGTQAGEFANLRGAVRSKRMPDDFEQTRLINDPRDRVMGDLLRESKGLTEEQIKTVVDHQKEHKIRFGMAAVALGLVSEKDVLWALARQFHYSYANEGITHGNHELVVAVDPFGEQAEAFRELRSQLIQGAMAPSGDRTNRSLALVSPDVGDGKTFFAANLATAFSQLEGRTLIVDADMRTPRLHNVFGVDGFTGLSNVLAGRSSNRAVHRVPGIPSLHVMPVGAVPPNPLELLQGPAFSMLLEELTRKFDYVLIDTSAASYGADSRVIASRCGATIAIGRKNKSRMPELNAMVKKFSAGPAKLAGVVLNEW